MNSHVYTVIPVHNRRDYTEACLRCLHHQTWPGLRVIVVDDGSTDGTSEMIREKFPEVTLLHGDGNLWWTGAINVGIRHALERAADKDYILIINDALEVNPDYVESLFRFIRAHPRSLVGSVTVDFDNPDLIDNGGIKVNWWTAKYRICNRGRRLSEFDSGHCQEVSTLTGRGTIIPVSAFRELGLYDDKHFQQCGDLELPVRASQRGYRLFVIYNAVVKSHLGGVSRVNLAQTYHWRDLKEYFFDIKSNSRLVYRYYFSRAAFGRNVVRNFIYLVFDFLRISYRFLSRLRFTPPIH